MSFGVWDDQNWDFGVKRSENPKVEFWADEASLKRAPSEQAQNLLELGRLSEQVVA
jgi:hypothetical protein